MSTTSFTELWSCLDFGPTDSNRILQNYIYMKLSPNVETMGSLQIFYGNERMVYRFLAPRIRCCKQLRKGKKIPRWMVYQPLSAVDLLLFPKGLQGRRSNIAISMVGFDVQTCHLVFVEKIFTSSPGKDEITTNKSIKLRGGAIHQVKHPGEVQISRRLGGRIPMWRWAAFKHIRFLGPRSGVRIWLMKV